MSRSMCYNSHGHQGDFDGREAIYHGGARHDHYHVDHQDHNSDIMVIIVVITLITW